jgi:myo-inositol 2-dehydrogenase / D-chiro-inositol 1-dehydrogenase
VKIAILGVGRLGAFHAKVLRELPGVDELRINDADAARAAGLAKELGAKHASSVDEALTGVDAAVIVTPTGTHADLIIRALDKGLAVFCEKPIALDLVSTKRVVDHVDKNRGRVQIGFQRRFDKGFQEARRRVRDGELGTVYSFHMTSRDAMPPPDGYIETSGGQFVDQLIHDFDVTRWMFGDEVEELYATGSTLGFPQYAKYDDVATSAVVLRLRGGAMGLLQAARHNEAGYDIRVDVYGAKDTIAVGLDPRTPASSVESDAPKLKSPAYPTFFVRFGEAYRAELAHFLRFAKGEVENACTVRDGMEALRLGLAATRSFKEHRPVAIKDVN